MDLVTVFLSLLFVVFFVASFAIAWRVRLALTSLLAVAGDFLAENKPEISVAFAALLVFSGLIYAGYVSGQARRAHGDGNGFGVIAHRAALPVAGWPDGGSLGERGERRRVLDRGAHQPRIGEFAAWCPVESGMVILRSRYLDWLRGRNPRPSRRPATAVTVKTDGQRVACEVGEAESDAQKQNIECHDGRVFTLDLDSKALHARGAAHAPDCVPYDFFAAHRLFS